MTAEIENVREPSMDENVSYVLEQQDVMRFLDTLPDNYRMALNMFLVEGYSHKEIGEHLGVTESSSRSLVSRARKMVVEAFKEEQKNEAGSKFPSISNPLKRKIISPIF